VLYVRRIQVLWEVTTLLQGNPLLLKITKLPFDSLGNAHTATKRHITEEGHAEITVTLDMLRICTSQTKIQQVIGR
jgi:hypothetical protein